MGIIAASKSDRRQKSKQFTLPVFFKNYPAKFKLIDFEAEQEDHVE